MTYTLVLMRHGESQWNVENKFTGWVDVPLTEKGIAEATEAGQNLAASGYEFDCAFTSFQKRAIKTCFITLEATDSLFVPVQKSWKLNERMYGNLQGMNKGESVETYGADKVLIWRRSFDVPPPNMEDPNHPYNPAKERKYASIPKEELPTTECLKDCIERVVPYWENDIVPAIKSGKRVLIAAHGNSLRGLVKYLDDISEDDILKLNIPTGVALVYTLDENMKPITAEGQPYAPLKGSYLGDVADIQGRINGVANQTAKK
ncbi:phosphoglycerate mutase [Sphaeroforma arctica JP610]|uniref:Phosphoglycerate mutase n=1 Tax=Sphaeroforma arctica JP610 TaxID=667725 RepID=A0A0L0FSN6_9EUKA|nr:phosphoglycerate mutase [Sphaeroforma arctica JP610]KNC79586.1 phosphoglycerate mutase [Sphaeroforma arctica JP610]|eukprot:XP_014153488.1 phosphoglycerate mutase [Sphaeroforma arctica JP610]